MNIKMSPAMGGAVAFALPFLRLAALAGSRCAPLKVRIAPVTTATDGTPSIRGFTVPPVSLSLLTSVPGRNNRLLLLAGSRYISNVRLQMTRRLLRVAGSPCISNATIFLLLGKHLGAKHPPGGGYLLMYARSCKICIKHERINSLN